MYVYVCETDKKRSAIINATVAMMEREDSLLLACTLTREYRIHSYEEKILDTVLKTLIVLAHIP